MTLDGIRFRTHQVAGHDQVRVEGKTTPHAEVVVENESAAPFGPHDEKSTFARVKADSAGRFALDVVAGREGDKLRLRAKTPAGASSVLTVRIEGTAAVDGRRPEISQQSLRLVEDGPGRYAFTNVSRNPRIGERGAELIFENVRTGETWEAVLDDKGRLPRDLRLAGEPGDLFALRVTDGVHTEYLREPWAHLSAPRKDAVEPPAGHDGKLHPHASSVAGGGALFVDGVSRADPVQGSTLGDCYLVAGAAAVADFLPDRLGSLFTEQPDGRVTVTFQRFDPDVGAYVPEPVDVTRELYTKAGGRALYGVTPQTERAAEMELWWPLLEKAYAKWKGGYAALGCGYPYEVFEALLGREGRHFDVGALSLDALYACVAKAVDKRAPMVAWTHPDSTTLPFARTGLVADHAYSVHGVKEEGGVRYVELRNPWGSHEPGDDGDDDGVFWLPLEDFARYYTGLGVASE